MAKSVKKKDKKDPVIIGSFDDVIGASVSGIGAPPKQPTKKPKTKKK